MTLRDYLNSLERGGVVKFAALLHVSPSFLSQMAAGTAPISPKRCVLIELLTDGAVSRKDDLHPTDWAEIWPELAGIRTGFFPISIANDDKANNS